MHLLSQQSVEIQVEPENSVHPAVKPPPLSRTERAHYRLSWAERLARKSRAPGAGSVSITLFGVPEIFATFLGLPNT